MSTTQAVAQGSSGLDQYSIANQQQAQKPAGIQDQFMQLMLAQLKNQDPTSPMDNSQFLSQLAQFNTATGIQDMGTKIDTLVNAMTSNQALQASSLVGHNVLVQGDTGYLASGGNIGGAVTVKDAVGNLQVQVFDGNGKLVRQEEMGAQASGQAYFVWDGKDSNGNTLAPGNYKFVAKTQTNSGPQTLDLQVAAQVGSVSLGKAGDPPTLNLVGLGPYSFSKVQQIM